MLEIDKDLARLKQPLSSRALPAALMFVKYFVADVSHGSKDNPTSEKWFAIIHFHVCERYLDNYGKAFSARTRGIIGALIVKGIPVEFHVPNTKSKIEVEGETAWMIYPSGIDDDEDPAKWLVNSPNPEKLEKHESQSLKRDMLLVASNLRQISVFVNTCEEPDSAFVNLVKGIPDELEASAKSLVANTNTSIQSSVWSLQMAMERTLKSLSIQQRGVFRETHDLFTLFDELTDVSTKLNRHDLKRFPRWRENVDGRYSFNDKLDLSSAFSHYKLCLKFIRDGTEILERKIKILDSGFLLKKPPYLDLD